MGNKLQEDTPNLQNKWGTKLWHECNAIGFHWDGKEDITETDIVFEPGYYMWNTHCILNWKTGNDEYDFIYLIQATGDRLKEDGTPKAPELYRHCPKGVVVSHFNSPSEVSDMSKHPVTLISKHPVTIIEVPGAVKINGEEFHFIAKDDALPDWIANWKKEALKVVV